jgi:hypothetical protein
MQQSRLYQAVAPFAVLLGITAFASQTAFAAPPADWSQVPGKTIKLFYPGQSSYDWLTSADHRRADKKVMEGDSCAACHEGEEADIGELIVAGERLEPDPIEGKNGWVDVEVQVAHDGENLHWRFKWDTNMDRAGQMHNYIMYDGEQWAFVGGPRSSDAVRNGDQPPLYEDRFAIMVDDGSVPLYAEQGCWLTCHTGMRDMQDEPSRDQVSGHPRLGQDGLSQTDIRKYIPDSRTDGSSWDKVKSAEEVAELKSQGRFLDLMQWRGHRSNPVGMSDDGYVLEYRLFDEGTNPFSWNVDRSTMTPKFMFDADKAGSKSITLDDIGDPSRPVAIIREQNAVPYDPDAGWEKGDVLPGRLLSRVDAEGSAADNDASEGTWEDGTWTLTWSRPLDTGHPEDDKILEVGGVYDVSFAIHDDNVTTRFHFVSFPMTLGIGVEADLEAVEVD